MPCRMSSTPLTSMPIFCLSIAPMQQPVVARLLKASAWLPFHPVNLMCGEKRAQLVGGGNVDTNEVCVLCACDACAAR